MSEQIMANNASGEQNYLLADQTLGHLYPKDRAFDGDESMVAGLRTRHETAFTEMVRRYQRVLLALALKITRNHEDAEEVVQDVFLKVFRRIESFRGDSLFRTWLTRIAINEALMKIRKSPKHHFSIDEPSEAGEGSAIWELAAPGATPEESYSLREIESMALSFFPRISRSSRPVVKLCLEMGLSPVDAAMRLGLNMSTVKSRLSRGRKELRKALARHCSRGGTTRFHGALLRTLSSSQ